jgi:HlyD family secretion protein
MEGLLPGMNVDARIVVEALQDVLTVPVDAVLRNNFVLLKTDKENPKEAGPGLPAGFVYTEVALGASSDPDILFTGGRKEGDVVALFNATPSAYGDSPIARSSWCGA